MSYLLAYPPADAHSGFSQVSMINLFIVTGFKLKLLIIFEKFSIADVRSGRQYASDLFYCRQLIKCVTIHE